MDIVNKRGYKGGQGNAASDYRDIVAAAGNWQYGNAAHPNDIEDEKREEDLAFGIPHEVMDFDPKKTSKDNVGQSLAADKSEVRRSQEQSADESESKSFKGSPIASMFNEDETRQDAPLQAQKSPSAIYAKILGESTK
jgi:hypothetical protein